ncbi:MAG: O-antigen ligase family protein [Bryobacteraceae bacterium]
MASQRPDPAVAGARPLAPTGPRHSPGNWLLVIILFAIFSRLPDFIAAYVIPWVPIVRILSVLALIVLLLSGGMKRALFTFPALLLIAFTFWLMVATPFSVWPGGSVDLLSSWSKSVLFFVATAGLIVTLADCERALYAIGWASVGAGLLTLLVGATVGGRLQWRAGTLANSNDLALFLVLGLPACFLLARNARSRPGKLAGAAGGILVAVLVVPTGSRMGLLMLVVTCVVLALPTRFATKIKLAFLALVVALIGLLYSGEVAVGRYHTLFSAEQEEDLGTTQSLESAAASARARRELLMKSIEVTLQHPIVGVGPGMFSVAVAGRNSDVGAEDLGWHQTHNSFTQVSSECGIPALLLWVVLLVYCIRKNFRLWRIARRRPDLERIANVSYSLLVWVGVFTIGAMLTSLAYDFFLPVMAGMTVGFSSAVQRELLLAPPPAGQPAAAPAGNRWAALPVVRKAAV